MRLCFVRRMGYEIPNGKVLFDCCKTLIIMSRNYVKKSGYLLVLIFEGLKVKFSKMSLYHVYLKNVNGKHYNFQD